MNLMHRKYIFYILATYYVGMYVISHFLDTALSH